MHTDCIGGVKFALGHVQILLCARISRFNVDSF